MSAGELQPGARIDQRYVLRRRLGVGGFGAVWLATDVRSSGITREVALKILHPRLREASAVVAERFRQEAEILARLDHPSVVKPLGFSADGEHAYLALEYVEGLPLDRVLKECARRREHLETGELVRIFDELAAAVHYLHGEGVVHRDLKPSNVMLVRRGGRAFVKVLDLGIARILAGTQRDATTVGRMLGSLHYASPEQIRGEPADAKSDVFALGVILFELVTSCRAFLVHEGRPASAARPPFRSGENTPPLVFQRITAGERPKVSDAREGVPLELDAIAARAMAIAPSARYGSAAELAAEAIPALRSLAASHGTTIFALAAELEPTADEVEVATEVRRLQRPAAPASEPTELEVPEVPRPARPEAAPRPTWMAPHPARPERPAWLRAAGGGLLLVAVAIAAYAAGASRGAGRSEERPAVRVVAPEAPEGPGKAAPAVVAQPREAPAVGAVTPGEDAAVEALGPHADGPGGPGTGGAAGGGAAGGGPPGAPVAGGVGSSREPPRAPRSAREATGQTAEAPPRAQGAAGSELTRLLAHAREAPDDLARVAALGDAVRAALKQLPEGDAQRTRLERRTEASAMEGDVEGLAACVRGLEAALGEAMWGRPGRSTGPQGPSAPREAQLVQ